MTPTTHCGRSARKLAPRSGQAHWNPRDREHDPLATILAQNEMRAQDLVPLRHGRMAASPWTYFRGAAAVMAADLASTPNTGITVQLCGDAHVLNFGLWKTPERNLSFDLRDFDETLPGPFEWDVKRLVVSLVVLARDSLLPESLGRASARAAYRGYARRIRRYAKTPALDVWYDKVNHDNLVDYLASYDADECADQLGTRITSRAQKRTSRGAFKKLTTVIDGRRRIVEDPPFRTHALGANDADPEVILRAYAASLPDHVAFLLNQFELADTARQVVGVGSVGMRVYLMLLLERRTLDPLFIQVKQAGPSVYERFSAPCGYEHHGQRVVNGQRMMQSASDLFLGWTVTDDGEFYVRQFRDGKVIPKAETIASRLGSFASMCGQVLARTHARTGSAAAIADYLGTSTKVEDAFVTFASAYADQNDRDHAQLAEAVARGAIPAAPGWG